MLIKIPAATSVFFFIYLHISNVYIFHVHAGKVNVYLLHKSEWHFMPICIVRSFIALNFLSHKSEYMFHTVLSRVHDNKQFMGCKCNSCRVHKPLQKTRNNKFLPTHLQVYRHKFSIRCNFLSYKCNFENSSKTLQTRISTCSTSQIKCDCTRFRQT